MKDSQVLNRYKKALGKSSLLQSHRSVSSGDSAINRDLLSVHTQSCSVIKVSKTYSEQEFGELKIDQTNKKSCGVEVRRMVRLLSLLSFR